MLILQIYVFSGDFVPVVIADLEKISNFMHL